MNQIQVRLGDVFEVSIDMANNMYFQYIGDDPTALDSQVIRVFKTKRMKRASPALAKVVNDDVYFYAHVFIRLGLETGLWAKVGNVKQVGSTDIMFRDSIDAGDPNIKISHDWRVWRMGEQMREVGALNNRTKKYDIGDVVRPQDIIDRMKTGEYKFVYPKFE